MVLFASGRTLQLSGFNMYICDITIEDRKRIYLTRSELTFVLESLALDFIFALPKVFQLIYVTLNKK